MLSTVETFSSLLERMERTLTSRLGAGMEIREAWNTTRWLAELQADLGEERSEIAVHLIAGVWENIRHARSPEDIRDVFDRMLYRIPMVGEAVAAAELELGPISPHLVYLLYDDRGRLLYVGVTDRGPVRLVEHYRLKPWFTDVTRVDFERRPSRKSALDHERYLIKTRRPIYNIQHNRRAA